MLQFLQCKTFGAHKVPEGWLIAAAGNPPEYNKSVREFDVVTLDRVKKIDVEPDFSVWKEYAYQQGIHGAILSYLEIRKDHFYAMETTVDGKRFVTARGWEDLSTILKVYEDMNLPDRGGADLSVLAAPQDCEGFCELSGFVSQISHRLPRGRHFAGEIYQAGGDKAAGCTV